MSRNHVTHINDDKLTYMFEGACHITFWIWRSPKPNLTSQTAYGMEEELEQE